MDTGWIQASFSVVMLYLRAVQCVSKTLVFCGKMALTCFNLIRKGHVGGVLEGGWQLEASFSQSFLLQF